MPQYFKRELYFKQLTGFYFFTSHKKKGPLLVVIVIKHTFATTQNMKPLHIYARHTTTVSCGIIAWQCIIYYSVGATKVSVTHQEKNWLSYKSVINYQVRSVIFLDCTQRGMVILTTIVLLDPWRQDQVVQKCRYLTRNTGCVTSQKTDDLNVRTAHKISVHKCQ